jgi:hypothetical protein
MKITAKGFEASEIGFCISEYTTTGNQLYEISLLLPADRMKSFVACGSLLMHV